MPTSVGGEFTPQSRWVRDPGIAELIQYFDQSKFVTEEEGSFYGHPENLSNSDWELVCKEIDKCRTDFVYAAKNYFWISNKDTVDQLFSLWECQELILEQIMKVRAMGLAQKFIILKARQLGISTLVEALIAWETMFNPNINALVVGPEKTRTEYLFSIMLHIYDQMPWWLKPMIASREYKVGLTFNNPNPEQRRLRPGLNSRIELQMASQYSGIGQGIRLTCAHISEIGDWYQDVARQAIDGDLGNALSDKSPMTFAIIESTAKGAGTYYHDLWRTNKEAGKDGDWRTIFIPVFMEKTRVLAPPLGWRPGKPEEEVRKQVFDTWLLCDNQDCARWKETFNDEISIRDTKCPYCENGILRAYNLADEQLRWMEQRRKMAEKKGEESLRELAQELCVTDFQAFQLSGDPVFPKDCLDFAEKCIRPPKLKGFMDSSGRFHGVVAKKLDAEGREIGTQCFQESCSEDHRWDDKPLFLWETPMEGHEYVMGVDVAEGLGGKHDYSVICLNRIGKGLNPDVQVGVWRSNTINHYDLAVPIILIGKWFNFAMAAIEYNTYQTAADAVRITYNYPNLYRWKTLDSVNSVNSQKWHWITQANSKPKLWGSMVRRLRQNLYITKSENLVSEMKTFQKDGDNEKKAGAEAGFHDDELMASMIALYTPHDTDNDQSMNIMGGNGLAATAGDSDEPISRYDIECLRCQYQFESVTMPDGLDIKCLKCSSILLKARRKGVNITAMARVDMEKLGRESASRSSMPSYDQL